MEICRYDPVQEFHNHEYQREQDAMHYPICDECGERILDEWCFRFGSKYICEDCIDDHKVQIKEEYIDE